MDWKRHLHRLGHGAERAADRLREELRDRPRGWDNVQVVPYLGHGTAREVRVRGRVLGGGAPRPPSEVDGLLDNLAATYRRFDSSEIARARVHARAGDVDGQVWTDDEGYFEIDLQGALPAARNGWLDVAVRVEADGERGLPEAAEVGRARVPEPGCRFGVISDVDDTVLQTQVTSLVSAARLTLFGNARTRLPFAGVGAFYRGLVAGSSGDEHNPVFYVSSSPWNLYDLLVDFLEHRRLPAGPLFLRDLGIDRRKFIQGPHRAHKLGHIEEILDVHPSLPFVLVGDSGQHDPEIYREVVHRHPGRILAIYIRDVAAPERGAAVERVAEGLRDPEVEMLLVGDTLAAAEHAGRAGLLRDAVVAEVESEVRRV